MIRPGIWRRELSVPLQSLQTELNRLFEEYWQPGSAPGAATTAPTDLATAVWTPAIDLAETPTELVLVVDLPGVDPTKIDLSLTGNVLTLRGEKVAVEVADGHARAHERPIGAFHRQVTLTEAVDFDRVQAESKNGVLTVRLPKQETARPRTIPIHPASS
jgi:HSP20 family protein